MGRRDRIEATLAAVFAPQHLIVRDVSAEHYGHAGWRDGGETHMEIEIKSAALAAMSRIKAHRAINQALADEWEDKRADKGAEGRHTGAEGGGADKGAEGGLHALKITVLR